jgi:hypothetical protein
VILPNTHQDIYYKKRTEIKSVGKEVEKLELLHIVGGNVPCIATAENSMAGTQAMKHRLE